jgi:tetratricopeptide (TPR) repeat protein
MNRRTLFLPLILVLAGCAGGWKSAELAREYYNLGNAYYDLGEYGRAADYLARAVELDKDFPKARFNLAMALVRDGRAGLGEEIFRDLLTGDPQNLTLAEGLAFSLYVQGRQEEAVRAYRDILSLEPGNSAARYNIGILFWQLEQREEALQEFLRLLESDPEDLAALFNTGKLLFELDRYEEAAGKVEEYLQAEPGDTDAYMLLAAIYEVGEKYDRALEAYDRALLFDETRAEAWFFSAQILLTEVEDPARGLDALEQALVLGYDDGERIKSLLDSPELLSRDKVEALFAERGLIPAS